MTSMLRQGLSVFREEGLLEFGRRGLRYVGGLLSASAQLIRMDEGGSVDETVRLAYEMGHGFIRPAQVQSELKALLSLVEDRKPRMVMEIGTARGGTLFCLCQVSAPHAHILSLDLPGGDFGGGYPAWKVPLYRKFTRGSQKLTLVRANSHKGATLDRVRKSLDGRQLDFLFIDGDHTYDGVKRDFELYSRLVRPGGIVALHDIVPHSEDPECEVNIFWEELQGRFSTKELVEDFNQGWAGIGLVFIKPNHRSRGPASEGS